VIAQLLISQQAVQEEVLAKARGLLEHPPLAVPATQAYGTSISHFWTPHCSLEHGVLQSSEPALTAEAVETRKAKAATVRMILDMVVLLFLSVPKSKRGQEEEDTKGNKHHSDTILKQSMRT
jgi:hypothetical protein